MGQRLVSIVQQFGYNFVEYILGPKRALVWFYSVISVSYINCVPARGTVMAFCINWDTLGFNFYRGTV